MTESKHTPTPIVGKLRVQQEPYPHLRDDAGTVLARDYEHTEKTEFICRAVNSFDAITRALNKCIGLITEFQEDTTDDELRLLAQVVADDARAALALATAGTPS